MRFAPTEIIGPSLIVLAAFLSDEARIAVWVVALAIDYLGPAVIGMGRGWHVAPEHFAERHGVVIIIALGESLIAIAAGFAEGFELGASVLLAAALGVVAISALWWLYFDVAALFAQRRLSEARGIERARLARDSYAYLHLPMVAGIVLFAFGLETTLHDIHEPLRIVPAAVVIPALASLAAVSAVCVLVVAYEAIRHRAARAHLRRPETAP